MSTLTISLQFNSFFDADSVYFKWKYKDEIVKVHHTGTFFKVLKYDNDVISNISLDDKNNDSLRADFYDIKKLKKKDFSAIATIELEKLGYKL